MKLTCPLASNLPTFRTPLRISLERTAILRILTGLELLQCFLPVIREHYFLLRHTENLRRKFGPQTLVFSLMILKLLVRVVSSLEGASLPRLPIIWPQLTTPNRSLGKVIATKQPHLLLFARVGPKVSPLVFIWVVVVAWRRLLVIQKVGTLVKTLATCVTLVLLLTI